MVLQHHVSRSKYATVAPGTETAGSILSPSSSNSVVGIKPTENVKKLGQDTMLEAEKTNGIGKLEREALKNITKACKYEFEKMQDKKLDALMSPVAGIAGLLAIGGYPGINVPAGYDKNGVPFGISFGGLKGSEPTLIEIAYGFEQLISGSPLIHILARN